MLLKEEIKNWIIDNGYIGRNKFSPRTELRISKNKNIKDSLMFHTSTFTNISLCERMLYIINEINEQKLCPVCHTPIPFSRNNCSVKCAANNKDVKSKRIFTNIKKYGVENPANNINTKEKISIANKLVSDIANQKRKNTNTLLYGKEHLLQIDKYKSKAIETTKLRYGVDNIFKDKSFIEKNVQKKKNNLSTEQQKNEKKQKKFKTDFRKGMYHYKDSIPLFTENDYNLTLQEREYKCLLCEKNFYRYSKQVKRCTHCFPIDMNLSEIEIYEYIKKFNYDVYLHDRKIITPFELDIIIPYKALAIEYDGLAYHSFGIHETWSQLNNQEKEDSNYHLHKTQACANNNIQLLHIFENEWLDEQKQQIWKSIISSKFNNNTKVYARKCVIKEVSNGIANNFLEDNHLQGKCSSSVVLGLYYGNELVSLLCLSKSRFNKNYDWEITRYCNKLNTNVLGGFSKLLKAFRKENCGSIITYADKRYSNGDMYRKCGFAELKDSKPNYWYWNFNNRSKKNGLVLESRLQYQKHKLKNKLEVFDETLTEYENMCNNGYRRIWDCGNKVFVMN